jgi:predicted nucleotidyltransferase component of viral defense system
MGLLKKLMALNALSKFNLVGGTALALQYGHRISIDLDLFTEEPFDSYDIKSVFLDQFGEENVSFKLEKDYTLLLSINDIKVDILHYPYKLIDDLIIEEGIRMLSPKDISAMKLSAISKRGAKKDFFDVYELLKNQFTISQMFSYYKEKFKNHELSFIARSLIYFDDAEMQEDPVMLKDYNWLEVKNSIKKEVSNYIDSIL